MNEFDRLLARGLDRLAPVLRRRRLSDAEIAEVVRALRDASFPALAALLASTGAPADELGQPLLHETAAEIAGAPGIADRGASAADVERALSAVFIHSASPESALPDAGLRAALMRAALDALAKRTGIALTPAQAESALALLATGRFFGDLASALSAALYAVRQLPIRLADDALHLPSRAARLVFALSRDLAGTPFSVETVFEDIAADGVLDHPPAVLGRTLVCLLGFASLETIARMIRDLLAPENASVRLLVVVYARAHGIPLEDSDLDLLRDSVFGGPNPDLAPALQVAVSRTLDQKGVAALLAALRSAQPPP